MVDVFKFNLVEQNLMKIFQMGTMNLKVIYLFRDFN